MSAHEHQSSVYTIAPDVAFLPALVRAVLEGRLFGMQAPQGLKLSRWTILLPTRRAARALREAFIEASPGTARILPVIRPLGDFDEDEVTISGGLDELTLPPAASAVERQFLLARLVREWAVANPASLAARSVSRSMSQALRMASSLMQLIDSLDTGEISLANVPELLAADPELPLHSEEALSFLRIIAAEYPQAMLQLGPFEPKQRMGPQERRSKLLRLEAQRLAERPTGGPIIAAGSTGSLPATAQLLKVVSRLPGGCVVLPGLDRGLDEDSWQQLSQQHPQYGMRELMAELGVTRDQVRDWPHSDRRSDGPSRELLASEIMRPTETTHLWKDISAQASTLSAAMTGITLIEAPEMREQALVIAVAMRKALDEQKRCALITPDRNLARRVSAELARWNVHVDDSAGEPLTLHPQGIFLELVAAAAGPSSEPGQVAALLGHPLIGAGMAPGENPHRLGRELEIVLFRQVLDGHRIDRITQHLPQARAAASARHAHPAARRLVRDASWQRIHAYASRLEQVFAPLVELAADDCEQPLALLLKTHVQVAEALARDAPDAPADRLWTGEAGAALSTLLRELIDHAGAAPPMRFSDYCLWIADCLRQVPVRRRFPLHPRLSIYGLLEARLVQPDIVILGGLNEGSWPAVADPGPWLSRNQHTLVNLQLPERRLGLAAHDFVQSLCAREVKLVWARKAGGTPVVPSRWVLRLKAVLEAAGLKDLAKSNPELLAIASELDAGGEARDLEPTAPQPKPPVSARPKRLSVTRVVRLLHDPYWAYAYYVLGLQPLPPLGQTLGPSERGKLAHNVLERFAKTYPDALPPDATEILKAIANEEAATAIPDLAVRNIWLPQLHRAVEWFADIDSALRADVTRIHVEVEGELEVPVGGEIIKLTGKADRIDELATGEGRIIDYKTGQANFSRLTAQDYSPQLDLEGWMLAEGAFSGIQAMTASELMYVRVSGGQPAGDMVLPKADFPADQRIETARTGFVQLMAMYQRPERGYPARTGDEAWGRRSDYDHLSRWREWGLGRDGDGDGAGEAE